MRTGGYAIQQSLSAEATSIVKQAVSLARRRGHAQVTPLHVASAMLASSTGLFRRACLQAHSHPLQCKALELCFNVALNRLPTSTSSPFLSPHSHLPSLSNALVAAFKRAQAHQRRGSIESQQQQQPILAMKVEVEQLVISILDDPSVSRVMREAGFSSTQLKTNVEQAVSLEICSRSPVVSTQSKETKPLFLRNSVSQITPTNQLRLSLSKTVLDQVQNEDVLSVVDAMMNKKRKNTVIIAEYSSMAEGVLRGVIDKFDKGDVLGDMRYVQFISVPLYTLKNITREEFELKLGELRSLVKGYISRGVVLYLGDLQWVAEFWSKHGELRNDYYSPVEHMIMELSRLSCGVGESGKLWLMGIANFKTFSKCKTGHPSLETLWDLHPHNVPVSSLGLSLNLESDLHGSKASGDGSSWLLGKARVKKNLNCCVDCLANFKKEARSVVNNSLNSESTTTYTRSNLPSWLQKYKEENRKLTSNDQEHDKLRDLCKKWNSICISVHKHPHFLEKAINYSSLSPSSSTSTSSTDQQSSRLHKSPLKLPVTFEPKQQSTKEHQFFVCEKEDDVFESKLTTFMEATKPDLLSNPNSSPNSASSSEASGDMECMHRFKEFNTENQKILCCALEKKVPWQRDIIPQIVNTVLQCRSGMMMMMMMSKNKLKRKEEKQETWLCFSGVDSEGKEKIARELARVVFGSEDSFVAIGLSSFSSTKTDSTEEVISKKRARDEHGRSYLERFADAVRENPSRVFFMEDVDQVENHSQKGIKKAIESGSFTLPDDETVPFKDAIVIFSCDSFSSISRASSSPRHGEKYGERKERVEEENGDDLEEKKPCTSLDLNISINNYADEHSVSESGIIDSVDKQIIFKIQVL